MAAAKGTAQACTRHDGGDGALGTCHPAHPAHPAHSAHPAHPPLLLLRLALRCGGQSRTCLPQASLWRWHPGVCEGGKGKLGRGCNVSSRASSSAPDGRCTRALHGLQLGSSSIQAN